MRKFFSLFIAVIFMCHLLAVGLPVADVDQDGRVDLGDAILAVQGLQNLSEEGSQGPAEKSQDLSVYFEKTVEAFKVLAGVKSFVPEKPAKTISAGYGFFGLLPGVTLSPVLPVAFMVTTKEKTFQSNELEPLSPPPRVSL